MDGRGKITLTSGAKPTSCKPAGKASGTWEHGQDDTRMKNKGKDEYDVFMQKPMIHEILSFSGPGTQKARPREF